MNEESNYQNYAVSGWKNTEEEARAALSSADRPCVTSISEVKQGMVMIRSFGSPSSLGSVVSRQKRKTVLLASTRLTVIHSEELHVHLPPECCSTFDFPHNPTTSLLPFFPHAPISTLQRSTCRSLSWTPVVSSLYKHASPPPPPTARNSGCSRCTDWKRWIRKPCVSQQSFT